MEKRIKKIRGIKRKIRQVTKWLLEEKTLRKDLLEEFNYVYSDIIIHPWCDISIIDSIFPEPEWNIKKIILDSLIEIYFSWKKDLDKYWKPYYLKIWLFEPRFSKSQVVCAIGDSISYYENNFYSYESKKINLNKYGILKEKMNEFNWECKLDEDSLDDNYFSWAVESWTSKDDYISSMKWFKKEKRKKHRVTKLNDWTLEYSFKRWDIWIGELKN